LLLLVHRLLLLVHRLLLLLVHRLLLLLVRLCLWRYLSSLSSPPYHCIAIILHQHNQDRTTKEMCTCMGLAGTANWVWQ
jgi:hypothetical protein